MCHALTRELSKLEFIVFVFIFSTMLDLWYEHIVFNVLASLYSIALTQISDNLTLTMKCGIKIKTSHIYVVDYSSNTRRKPFYHP